MVDGMVAGGWYLVAGWLVNEAVDEPHLANPIRGRMAEPDDRIKGTREARGRPKGVLAI